MKQRWIAYYVGVGEHDYTEVRREGPLPSMVAALERLERDHGRDWVDENVVELVTGPLDGSIAWLTDSKGVSIEDHPAA